MKNINYISNKNSKDVVNGSPKLPLATDLADGEIAVNFAKDYETLAIKNESGDVITFSSDNKFYKKSETSGATEIQTALGNKQDTLVSGSNIKTINNTSILGSGNITIEQIQSDWNESDSSKLSYIENKPFGETIELETLYDSGFTGTQVGPNYGGGQINLADKHISLSDFDTQYKVTINGETQFVKLVKFANNSYWGLNIESGAGTPYTETWSMWTNNQGGTIWAFAKYGAIGEEITLKIEKSNATINKLDNKYVDYENSSYIQSIVTRIDNITIEGGFIELVNPSADTKVGLVNKLSQYYDTNIGKGAVIEGDGYEFNGKTYNIVASGDYSHAEGKVTKASGKYSHAEGEYTTASGEASHAEGYLTKANGYYSHTEGRLTNATNDSEHASGQYNVSSSASTTFGDSGNTLFSVGNGTSDNARHNAFEIRQNGDIYITSGSTDIKLQDHLGSGGGSSTPIVILTQSEYDALTTKDDNTVYIIK